MVNHISQPRSNSPEDELARSNRLKPFGPLPGKDDFRKAMDQKPPSKESSKGSSKEGKVSKHASAVSSNTSAKNSTQNEESVGSTSSSRTPSYSTDEEYDTRDTRNSNYDERANRNDETREREPRRETIDRDDQSIRRREALNQDEKERINKQRHIGERGNLEEEIKEENEAKPSLMDLSRSSKTKYKEMKNPLAPKEAVTDKKMSDQKNLSDEMDIFANEFYAEEQTGEMIVDPNTMRSELSKLTAAKQQNGEGSRQIKGIEDKELSSGINRVGDRSKEKKGNKSSSKTEGGKGEIDPATLVRGNIAPANFQTETSPQNGAPLNSETIKNLAAQLIDQIQIMQKGDETQTTITLRNPPILEGATITLTATEHAKREFNISFANLSPEAKSLLDRQLAITPLSEALGKKDIVVHIVTTTIEAGPTLVSPQNFREQQGRGEQQGGQQGQEGQEGQEGRGEEQDSNQSRQKKQQEEDREK